MLMHFVFSGNSAKKFSKSLVFTFLVFASLCAEIEERTDVYFSHEYRDDGRVCSADMGAMLANLISTAKRRIYMAIYMITDEKIARAIINVKDKNPKLDISIVVDETSVEYSGGKAVLLAQHGIKVYIFNFDKLRACKEVKACCNPKHIKSVKKNRLKRLPLKVGRGLPGPKSAIMHNKYVVVDDIFWSGSFNFTNRANFANQENAMVTTNKDVVQKAVANFKNHLRHVDELIPSQLATAGPGVGVDNRRGSAAKMRWGVRNSSDWSKKRMKELQDSDYLEEEDYSFFVMAKRWYNGLRGVIQKVFV
jgi:phosphatidylserine/phosphatidylglycerophosphate/cardiolipin synthase-like enzyme